MPGIHFSSACFRRGLSNCSPSFPPAVPWVNVRGQRSLFVSVRPGPPCRDSGMQRCPKAGRRPAVQNRNAPLLMVFKTGERPPPPPPGGLHAEILTATGAVESVSSSVTSAMMECGRARLFFRSGLGRTRPSPAQPPPSDPASWCTVVSTEADVSESRRSWPEVPPSFGPNGTPGVAVPPPRTRPGGWKAAPRARAWR